MSDDQPETPQERSWGELYDGISNVLTAFGKEDGFGRADYLLVDDNYGWTRHTIEIQNLKMLNPDIVSRLHALLSDEPNWDIVIVVDIPGTEQTWPRMGVTIRKHEIIDGLQRSYLPPEYQSLTYPGSRPGTGYD